MFILLNYCDKVGVIFENETLIVNVGIKITFKTFFDKNNHFKHLVYFKESLRNPVCHLPSFDRPQGVTRRAVGAHEEIVTIKTII